MNCTCAISYTFKNKTRGTQIIRVRQVVTNIRDIPVVACLCFYFHLMFLFFAWHILFVLLLPQVDEVFEHLDFCVILAPESFNSLGQYIKSQPTKRTRVLCFAVVVGAPTCSHPQSITYGCLVGTTCRHFLRHLVPLQHNFQSAGWLYRHL